MTDTMIRDMSRDELVWFNYYMGWNDMETMYTFGEENLMTELLETPDRYLRMAMFDFDRDALVEAMVNSVGYMDHMIDRKVGYTIRETGEHFATFEAAVRHIEGWKRNTIFTRVRSYYQDGKFTSCEQLYLGNDQVLALERFRNSYPEHSDCILVAETYDSEAEKNREHFAACQRCGCVNY